MRHLRNGSGLPKPLVWLGIGVLAAIVGALVITSLQQSEGEVAPARPAPTVALQPTKPPPTPLEGPPQLAELTPSFAMLSNAEDGVFWRATSGSCAPDTAANPPTIERSGDGESWEDVTPPTSTDVRQVLWLQAIDVSSAEAVVLVGPACETQVLRTFTSGNFWEPYPSSITDATVIDASAGIVRAAGAELPLPCAVPVGAVNGGAANTPTVLCSGQVASWSGEAWQASELTNVVAASVSQSDGTLVTAREATSDCDGVMLERWAAGAQQNQRCIPGTGVLAVQAAGEQVWVWSAAGIEVVSWAI